MFEYPTFASGRKGGRKEDLVYTTCLHRINVNIKLSLRLFHLLHITILLPLQFTLLLLVLLFLRDKGLKTLGQFGPKINLILLLLTQ